MKNSYETVGETPTRMSNGQKLVEEFLFRDRQIHDSNYMLCPCCGKKGVSLSFRINPREVEVFCYGCGTLDVHPI